MHALAAFFEPAARIAVATLFNSLWEGALLAVAVWALLNYLPNINATTRYAAWCVALIAALVVPVVTAIPQVSVQTAPAYHHTAAPLQTTAARTKLPSSAGLKPAPPVSASQPATLAPSFPGRLRFALPEALALGIFAVWIAASLFLLMRLTFNLFKLETLKRDALPLSLDYREQLARWTRAEKGGRDVRLCVSDHIEVPVAVGLFDSMVLIPKHLLERLSEKEIDQITLHELAHLRRADDWTNGLQRIIQAIFFFNPAVLFMAQQLDLEREVACDDWVLHQTGDVRPYATCLTRMAEVTAWPHRALAAPGVFITRRGLSVRVERLLRAGRNVRTSVSFGPAGAVAAALIVTFFVAQNWAPSFAFTLTSGAHVTQTHSVRVHAPAPAKLATQPVRTTVGAFPAPIVAAATPAARATSLVTKKQTKVVKRTTIHGGMVDVNVPAVNVHVPEVNVNVPSTEVHVPAVDVHVPAISVNIPAMRYKLPYGYKTGLKRVADLNGSCTGCDFSGVQWAGRNLSHISLVGSDFRNADLHGANFSYANLSGVDFKGANLRNANFANANMNGCSMRGADLTGANFGGAQLNGCDIDIAGLSPEQSRVLVSACTGCNFKGVNLRGQNLRGVSVSGDNFSNADLRGADLRNASFNGVDFKYAKLDGALLAGASFNGCDFTGVDLRNVDLSHAQITGSRINIMR
jgi:uncharacterized protein YjbI with pentapeptide repeats/beta-lactamase regulating signal transducer with metallopeptidase domain